MTITWWSGLQKRIAYLVRIVLYSTNTVTVKHVYTGVYVCSYIVLSLLHKSRRTRLKQRLIIIFVSLKNCAFMENLNSDININVIWSCTIMKLIYWGFTLRFTASSAIKCHERKGKENETKRNEHDDSSWSLLYMAVCFGFEILILTWQTAQLRSRNSPHGSRPVVTLLEVLWESSSYIWYYTYICTICIYVLACVSLCTH